MADNKVLHGRRATYASQMNGLSKLRDEQTPKKTPPPVRNGHCLAAAPSSSVGGASSFDWTTLTPRPKNCTVYLPDGEEKYRWPTSTSAAAATSTFAQSQLAPASFTPSMPILRSSALAGGECSRSVPTTSSAASHDVDVFSRGVRPPPNVIAPSTSPPSDTDAEPDDRLERRRKASHQLSTWLTAGCGGRGVCDIGASADSSSSSFGVDYRPLSPSSLTSSAVSARGRQRPLRGAAAGSDENSTISTNLDLASSWGGSLASCCSLTAKSVVRAPRNAPVVKRVTTNAPVGYSATSTTPAVIRATTQAPVVNRESSTIPAVIIPTTQAPVVNQESSTIPSVIRATTIAALPPS